MDEFIEGIVIAAVGLMIIMAGFYVVTVIREIVTVFRGRGIPEQVSYLGSIRRYLEDDYEEVPPMSNPRIKILIEKYGDSYTATAFDDVGHLTTAYGGSRDKAITKVVKKLTALDYDVSEETLTIEDMNT